MPYTNQDQRTAGISNYKRQLNLLVMVLRILGVDATQGLSDYAYALTNLGFISIFYVGHLMHVQYLLFLSFFLSSRTWFHLGMSRVTQKAL